MKKSIFWAVIIVLSLLCTTGYAYHPAFGEGGVTWLSGSDAPTVSEGEIGNYYYITGYGEYYEKVAGSSVWKDYFEDDWGPVSMGYWDSSNNAYGTLWDWYDIVLINGFTDWWNDWDYDNELYSYEQITAFRMTYENCSGAYLTLTDYSGVVTYADAYTDTYPTEYTLTEHDFRFNPIGRINLGLSTGDGDINCRITSIQFKIGSDSSWIRAKATPPPGQTGDWYLVTIPTDLSGASASIVSTPFSNGDNVYNQYDGKSYVVSMGLFVATNIVFTTASTPSGRDAGETWYLWTYDPSSGIGEEADFFLNEETNHYFLKTSGVWVDQGLLEDSEQDEIAEAETSGFAGLTPAAGHIIVIIEEL